MSMKDLASSIRRARLPVKRGSDPQRKLRDVAQEEEEAGPPPPVFGSSLDSWEPRYRPPEEKRKVPETQEPRRARTTEITEEKVPEIEEAEGYEVETRTAQRMKRNKTRNMSLTVSVSEEEHRLLRKHAASLGIGFSAWARGTLFRAMGRKPPSRPQKD